MRKILVIVSLALFLGAVSFIAFYNIANHDKNVDNIPNINITGPIEENKIPGGEDEFVPGNSVNLPQSNLNIKVDYVNVLSSTSLHVRGEARTFESIVNFKLFDANGTLLVEDSTMANTHVEGVWGRFSTEINFPVASTATGVLQVFQYSAVDLQEIDKIMIPVSFVTESDISDCIRVDQTSITADENALRVSGQAIPSCLFESTIVFELLDENNSLVKKDFTTVSWGGDSSGLTWQDFSKVISFNAPSTVNGTLEIYDENACDDCGNPKLSLVTVPVYFQYNDQMEVKVYFNHNAKAGMPDECSYTQATSRYMTRTTGVARAALTALLQGPTNDEKNNGYFSNIPVGTTLNSIRIENGTAYADFSEELNNTGGSCAVGGIYASINDTLKQFSTVQNVVISVNGRTEDILQP